MKSIIALSKHSTYEPKLDGAISRLYNKLMEGHTSDEAYKALGLKNNSGSALLSQLKDELVSGLQLKANSRFGQQRNNIFEKFYACLGLLSIGNRTAWLPLAKDLLTKAKKFSEIGIAHRLAEDLAFYYSIVNTDTEKFKKYTEAEKELKITLEQNHQVYKCYRELVFAVKKKRNVSHFLKLIKQLEEYQKENSTYIFNYRYYLILATWYQYQNDWPALIKACENAIDYFIDYDKPLPPSPRYFFHFILIPTLVVKQQFSKAESVINRGEKIPDSGTYNWHVIQLYRAITGFHSQKIHIALSAYQYSAKCKKPNEKIKEQWLIIKAYLVYFQNKGSLKTNLRFRLGTFLNSVPNSEQLKEQQNISILVVKCLHYLQQGKKMHYMNTVEYFEQYVQKHLRGKEHTRHRALLRCLRNVEMADYNLIRWEAMSKKHLRIIEKNTIPISIDFMESEVLPCEMVIEELRYLMK